MMVGLRTVVAALPLSSIAFLVSCADPSGPAAPPAASVDLGAASLHLAVGQRLELPAGPSPVSGGLSMSTVDVGFAHACGVTLDGDAYCWGRSVYGELGSEGAPEECGWSGSDCSTRPVRVSGTREFGTIAAATFFTCGLTPSDGAFCWGDGHHGKLGDGRVEHSRTPVAVTGSSTFTKLSAGGGMTCALDQGGSTFCWGSHVLHVTGERPVTTEIPTRSAPEARLGSIDVGWNVCGIRSDGITVCRAEGSIEVVPGQ